MNDFIIFPKTGRMIWLGLMCLVFVLVGAAFLGFSIVMEDILWLGIIGVVTISFFGLCMIFYIKEIVARKPMLIVSDEGIMDRSSFVGAGIIKWSEMADIDFISYGDQVFLGIYTYDPELIINRTSGVKSMLNKINRNLIAAQVSIPVKNLDCSMEELVEVINNYWTKALENTEIEFFG